MTTSSSLPELEFTEDGRKVFAPDGEQLCRYMQSRAPVSGIRGPIGSGKTLGSINKIWQISCEQRASPIDGLRKTRWGVVRNTYPDLEGSTVKDFVEWFPPEHYGEMYWSRPLEFHMALADVRCEVVFMALDRPEDVKKLRSTQFTGFYFAEMQYIDKAIFDDAHGRTGRFPSVADGGATWNGIIFDMNEPSEDHWLVQMTGEVPYSEDMTPEERAMMVWPREWEYFVQPPALVEVFAADGKTIKGYRINPKAENTRWLLPSYYRDKVRGKDKRWIDSRLMNRISVWVDGKPVWSNFNEDTHVAKAPLAAMPGYPIVVGLDFGRSPAAVFGQLIGNRWYVLDELVAFDTDSSHFAPLVKRRLDQRFPGYEVRIHGDPKGADKPQSESRTSYDVFAGFGMKVLPAPCPDNNIALRVGAVSYVLSGLHDGAPRWLMDPTRCRTLKVAMAGKYHYRKIRGAGLYDEKPNKDRYSNVADAAQYMVLGEGEGRAMVGRPAMNQAKPVKYHHGRGSRRRVA
jgi:hypothetical protein